MTNPYAPPRAMVQDIGDATATAIPADRGTRLGAAILDSIIFGAMVYLPFLVAVGIGAAVAANSPDSSPDVMIGIGAVVALIGFGVWCYLTLTFVSRNSQSIAKKLLGIKVVRSDGSPVSMGRLIWMRNVLNWVISIVPAYGLIDVLFIFGETRQCLHDKIADTIVVRA